MFIQAVGNEFARRRSDSLHVRVTDSCQRRVLLSEIVTGKRSVVRASVVVGPPNGVKVINRVRDRGPRTMTFSGNRAALAMVLFGGAALLPEDIKRSVRHIARESLVQRAMGTVTTISSARTAAMRLPCFGDVNQRWGVDISTGWRVATR